LPAKLAQDASKLLAQNYVNFLALIVKDGVLKIDENDEIIKATRI
jgi:NAD/NADP transhydrogenase alpha subunit